jgi:DHA1 family bicyclomycin/chloramphenicol resistance-like MFS transporter
MHSRQSHSVPSIGTQLIILLSLLTALDAMAIDMYLPSMPGIAAEFAVPSGRIQQTLSIFLAGLAIGQALYGPLLDRYGRKTPLLAGIVIFIIGSVMAAVAPSVEWLMVARFIQALGAAAGLVTPRAIISDVCTMNESARIFSTLMQVMMIAPIVAPLAGSYVLAHSDWRAIFWIIALLGVIGLVWSIKAVPNSLPKSARTPLHLGSIVRAYIKQCSQPVFMAYTIAGGLVFGSLFTYLSTSSFIFTTHFALTPAQFSYLFAANSVALVIGGQLSNMLLQRGMSTQRTLMLGLILHSASACVLSGLADNATFMVYGALLALSIGALGLILGNLTALTMAQAGTQVGVASALMGTLHYLVSAIIGYVVSVVAQGPAALPIAITGCGITAILFCLLAQRKTRTQSALA